MGVVLRPKFGQACFLCSNPVPWPRIRMLQTNAAETGTPWLKSDVVCIDCQRLAGAENVTTTRPRHR
jgi:hypothetical protein